MAVTLYVVLSRDSARFLESNIGKGTYRLVKTLKNKTARVKNRSLTSDQAGMGHVRQAGGGSFYRYTEEKTPREIHFERFIQKVGETLNSEFNKHNYSNCVIVASTNVLGKIKKELSLSLKNYVQNYVNKDFGHASIHDLPRLIQHANRDCRIGTRLVA